jgi:hypothetical protein
MLMLLRLFQILLSSIDVASNSEHSIYSESKLIGVSCKSQSSLTR